MKTSAPPNPLFIPLKTEFFEAFECGEKKVEYRPYGPRWNEKTCAIGRVVVLSHGYGKQRRLRGTVTGFRLAPAPSEVPAGWVTCYGSAPATAACIEITLSKK